VKKWTPSTAARLSPPRRTVWLFTAFVGLAACVPASRAPGPGPHPAGVEELAQQLSGFIWPLPLNGSSEVTSTFGPRAQRHHDGLDLRARHGDPIFAARDGVVRFSGSLRGYGLTVILDHGGGVSSLYAHASVLYVRRGDTVVRGEVIAAVGATGNATGPHLHFEVMWAGVPFDPLLLLPRLARR
jgi:murein DD-endopeptidase MepM/ murein hydrolase activator NlpD